MTDERLLLLQQLARQQVDRTFHERTPFEGDALYIDEALTLIAAALIILADILAHSDKGPDRAGAAERNTKP